jgi:hypothetical protein
VLRMTMVLIALLAAGPVLAADAPSKQAAKAEKVAANDAQAKDTKATGAQKGANPNDAKTLAGISILGNQEAPKSLVIVPWKGSEIGDMPGLSRLLDDSVQPVDKDVFMRELTYYQIRSGK